MNNGDVISEVTTKDWNGYGFKLVSKTDYPAVLNQLQNNFCVDEPIHQVLGVTEDRIADIRQKVSDILDLGHGSFYAYPLEDPTKIAAVLIIWIQEKGKELPPFEPRSPLTIIVKNAIVQLKKRYSIHEHRGLDAYPELFIISTDKDHRGKGLATEMYRKAIVRFKSEGYPLVSSTFTNPLSRKMGERLGFKQVSQMHFNECKNEDGSLVFGEAGKNHFAIETVLDLQ